MKTMPVTLRTTQPADYLDTEHVTREAFWNQYAPGCCEHYLLHTMRQAPAFMRELDFVAVAEGRIVGNAVCVKASILTDGGQRYNDVLTLGPISVLPAFQRRGIGRKLITHTRTVATSMGYRAILLCGDPAYYTQVGFTAAECFGIRTSDNLYAAALHACPLYEGALADAAGRYYEDSLYYIDLTLAETFDRQFPPLEKLEGTPSQKRFEKIVAMQKACQ